MEPVQAIFFDLDGTLIDDDGAARLCAERTCLNFEGCAPGFDPALAASTYLEAGKRFWQHRAMADLNDYSSRLGQIRAEQWADTLLACGIDAPRLGADFAAFYGRLREETVVQFDDAAAVLDALKARFRIAVITNGAGDIQRRKIAAADLMGYVDLVIASTDVDAAKPDRRIFEAALNGLGAEAATTWHVGDNLAADVGGALNAGINAAWINRGGEARPPEYPEPHVELRSLRELLPLLGL